MNSKFTIICDACKKEFPNTFRYGNCSQCDRPLRFNLHLDSVKWTNIVSSSKKNMWRYFDLLPINSQDNIVSLGEGMTPLVRLKELERDLGGVHLYAKLELSNLTGTFKDREASLQ